MDFAHGETLTLRSTVTTDDGLGNTTAVVTESPWGPCAVAPRYANESTDPRVAPLVVGLTVYGPTVAIDADDTLVYRGVEYQVDGLPGEWQNPFTGWAPGMEVAIKRTGPLTATVVEEPPAGGFRTVALGEEIAYESESDSLYSTGEILYDPDPVGDLTFVLVDGLAVGGTYAVTGGAGVFSLQVVVANDESMVSLESLPLGAVSLTGGDMPLETDSADAMVATFADAGVTLETLGFGVSFTVTTPPFTVTEAP